MGQLGHADSAWQKVKGTYMGEMPSTFSTLEFSLVGAIFLGVDNFSTMAEC